MTTIKSYTNIKQCKQLAEFLSTNTADMCYLSEDSLFPKVNYCGIVFFDEKTEKPSQPIPCWSLAALLNLLPNYTMINNGYSGIVTWSFSWNSHEHDNPIDACVEMIVKLHEQNIL